MKKIIRIILLLLIIFPCVINAKELNIYLFYGESCPHCKAEEEYLNEYLKTDKDVILHTYEVWNNEDNQEKLLQIEKITNYPSKGVPYLVIGEKVITGFVEDATEETIENTINYYKEVPFKDNVGIYLGVVDENNNEEISSTTEKPIQETYKVPILGKINPKNVSLLLISIIIGLVDGFNPCAMWILIFLISMLLGMENKKRMWILGITFILTSGIIYFLFMISWLNLATLLNKVIFIRIGISLIAVLFGTYSILKFISKFNKPTGCEVTSQKGRKKIIKSIERVVKEKTFFIAIIGIIALAASVNVIELLCSLGLPVMFSEILSLNNLNLTSKIIYNVIYVLFFLLDDIIIFIIAMKTLEIKAISNKYGKYSHLIGGIIMLIIGILMLYKPEWLMFNF